MTITDANGELILCLAVSHTGDQFVEELAQLGCRPVLLTIDEVRDAGWPGDAISELHSMPANMTLKQITNTVMFLARSRRFARIIALDHFNVQIAAALREHMRIPGMGVTTAGYFSDKLAACLKAAQLGIKTPAFISVSNYDELRHFMQTVPPPWLLTPRSESCDSQRRQLDESQQVWRVLDELGDYQSGFMLEQWAEGDRIHIDSLTADGAVVFSAVSPYRPATAEGSNSEESLLQSPKLRRKSEIEKLRSANAALLSSMRMARGIAHMEFIRSKASGEFYFREVSARVDARCVTNMMEATHGLNLWREWARLEVAAMRGERYSLTSGVVDRKRLAASSEGQHRLA